MAKSPRYWAGVAVVVCWGAALGWLALRQTGQSDLSRIATQASLRLAPGDAWFRVMAGPVQIGYAGITLDTLADGRYWIREQVALELPGDTALVRTIRSTEYYLGASLAIDSLVSRLARVGRRAEFRGVGDGSGWRVTTSGDGPDAAGRLELPAGNQGQRLLAVPVRVVPLRLAMVGALATGDPRTLPVAGGWPATAWNVTLAAQGDSVAVYADSSDLDPAREEWIPVTWDTARTRALVVDAPDGPMRLTLDPRGTVVSLEHALGVRWLREDFNVARINFRRRLGETTPDIRGQLPLVRRATTEEVHRDTTPATSRYRITRRDGSAIDPDLLALLAGGRQAIVRGNLEVSVHGTTSNRTTRNPTADPLVQRDDSAVVALAETLREVLGRDGPAAVARELARRVTRDPSPAAASDAAGAARSRRASPEGMARLLAAVLGRLDVRARLAIGIRPHADTLLTHAWVEVLERGTMSWRPVDPWSGEDLPTAWVRLALAGSAEPEDLLPLVADVRFTPVSSSAPQGDTP